MNQEVDLGTCTVLEVPSTTGIRELRCVSRTWRQRLASCEKQPMRGQQTIHKQTKIFCFGCLPHSPPFHAPNYVLTVDFGVYEVSSVCTRLIRAGVREQGGVTGTPHTRKNSFFKATKMFFSQRQTCAQATSFGRTCGSSETPRFPRAVRG